MNKKELLTDLLGQTYVNALVGDPELQETKPNGDKWYWQNIREVVGNIAKYKNVHFYVIDEGKTKEKAYYKDTEIKQSIAAAEITP